MDDAISVLPWVLAVVGSLTVAVHGRAEHLDLVGQMANISQESAHSPEGLLRVEDLLPDDRWQWSDQVTVARLERFRGRPHLNEVRLAQLFAGHLEEQKFMTLS